MKNSGCCKEDIASFADRYCCCMGWHCCCSMGISLAKAIFCGTIWLLSHPVINNVSCCVAQPCWNCLPWWQCKNLWPTHLLQWRSQRHKLHPRHHGASLQWWGVATGMINFTVSALAPARISKVVAQSPIVARGLSLPCTAYVALRPFVARGSWSSCMTYAANCPCGKGLVVLPSPVAILGKGFVVAFFGKRLFNKPFGPKPGIQHSQKGRGVPTLTWEEVTIREGKVVVVPKWKLWA